MNGPPWISSSPSPLGFPLFGGAIACAIGFVGPMILTPGARQGPRLGRSGSSMASWRRSATMLLPAGPLALWGAWALHASIPQGSWLTTLLGGVALLTAGGLLLRRPWARPFAYFFAAWLALGWLYGVGQVIQRGWPYADRLASVLSLVPGILLLGVCAGGSWIVHRQYRPRKE